MTKKKNQKDILEMFVCLASIYDQAFVSHLKIPPNFLSFPCKVNFLRMMPNSNILQTGSLGTLQAPTSWLKLFRNL